MAILKCQNLSRNVQATELKQCSTHIKNWMAEILGWQILVGGVGWMACLCNAQPTPPYVNVVFQNLKYVRQQNIFCWLCKSGLIKFVSCWLPVENFLPHSNFKLFDLNIVDSFSFQYDEIWNICDFWMSHGYVD